MSTTNTKSVATRKPKDLRFEPGMFESTKKVNLKFVKELKAVERKDPNTDRVTSIMGQWQNDKNNIIEFRVGQRVNLTKEDLELPNIINAIKSGQIKRTF